MITEARASALSTDVELRNQIDYFGSRCTGVTTADAPVVPPVSAPVTPPRDTTAAPKKMAVVPSKTATEKGQQIPTRAPLVRDNKGAPTPPVRDDKAGQGIYTIQLAAYNTRADAEQLVKKLAVKEVAARVSGTTKPFRVRLAFFPTRQAAQNEVASLKERGIIGFVTTEERAPTGKSP
jgi:cell division protein FtsN